MKTRHANHTKLNRLGDLRWMGRLGMLVFLGFTAPAYAEKTSPPYDFSKARFPIPENVEELFVRSNEQTDAPAVVLTVQGGPTYLLDHGFKPPSGSAEREQSDRGYHNQTFKLFTQNCELVSVHQINTLRPEISEWCKASFDNPELLKDELTLDLAEEICQQNAEIIIRVASHFKAQGKEVYVYAYSYGCLLMQLTLQRYPDRLDLFDKVVLAVGRLDLDDEIIENYTQDNYARFKWHEQEGVPFEYHFKEAVGQEIFIGRMMHAVAGFDYTKTLADCSLPRDRVLYLCGENDADAGRLTAHERAFAKKKFTLCMVQGHGHQLVVAKPVLKQIQAFYMYDHTPPEEFTFEW